MTAVYTPADVIAIAKMLNPRLPRLFLANLLIIVVALGESEIPDTLFAPSHAVVTTVIHVKKRNGKDILGGRQQCVRRNTLGHDLPELNLFFAPSKESTLIEFALGNLPKAGRSLIKAAEILLVVLNLLGRL